MKHSKLTLHLLISFLLSFLLFFPNSTTLKAEGTSSIAPSTADGAALFVGAGNTGSRGGDYGLFAWKDSDSKLHFNIQDRCETVYLGFSSPRNDRSFADINPVYGGSGIEENLIFRIVDPLGNPINNLACFGNTTINGEVWQTLNSTTANISSRQDADNGPSQLGNNLVAGYNAFTLDLAACGLNLTGNYSIEFYSTDPNYDPNTSRSGFYIPFFDITVADCNNTGLTGRVWSNNWGIGIQRDGDGSFDRAFNGSLYVCSAEGFITKIDFNTNTNNRVEAGKNTDQRSGFRAGSFNIAFNQQGPRNTGSIESNRQSLQNVNSTNPQLPVFLNLPDEAFCPVQEIGEIKAAAEFVTGCPQDRCINVAATQPGQFEIIIEGANGNGILDQPSERRIIHLITEADKVTNPETAGFIYEACIPWDGKDGNGNLLLEVAITVTGNYFQGIYHFPVYDAEFNDDGFIVETVRPALGRQLLYYDDTNITEISGSTESKDGTNGCVGPCHRWTGEWEDYANADDNYGNFNTINTWWFASTQAQDFTNNVGQLSPLSIVCPPDFSGCTNQSLDPTVTGQPTIIPDDSGCAYTLDYADVEISNDCTTKVIQRTWTVFFNDNPTDKKSCSQTITVKAPVLSNCPSDVVLDCNDSNIYNWTAPTVIGCAGTVRQTSGPASGSTFPVGTTTISYEIEDGCGNKQVCSFTVTVKDSGNEGDLTISCPADYEGCVGDKTTPDITGEIILPSDVAASCPTTLDYSDTVIDNGCDGETIKREWVVYFTNNPSIRKTCTQTITLNVPTLTNCPSDVVLDCNDSNIYNWTAPTVVGCAGTVRQTSGPASGSTFPSGTTTISYEVGDGCGNNQTCSFTVTVNNSGNEGDLTINCPADYVGCVGEKTTPDITGEITLPSDVAASCPTTLDYSDTVIDNGCDGEIIKREWVVYFTNNPSIRKTCTQTITLKTPTLANCPTDVVLNYCSDGNTYSWTAPTVTGCAGTVRQTSGPASGSTFPVGTTTVSYEVGDGCGNNQTCSFTVTVNNSGNTGELTITCPPDFSGCSGQSTDPSITGTATVSPANPTCPYTVQYSDIILGDDCGTRTIQRTWFVYFENNPTERKTCTQTITLGGVTIQNCPVDVVLDCDEENIYSWEPPTGSGCTSCSDTTEIADFMYMGERGGHRYYCSREKDTWQNAKATAESLGGYLAVIDDPAENAFCANFLVNQYAHIGLTDEGTEGHFRWVNGAPLNYTNWYKNQPNNHDGIQHYGQMVTNGQWNDGNPTDSLEYIVEVPCVDIIQTSGPLNGSTFPIGTSTVTYEVGNGCGATTTCSFTVTVDQAISVECPSDVVLDCENGQNGATYTWPQPTASSCCNDCPAEGQDLADFVYMGSLNGHQYYCSKEKAHWSTAKSMAEREGGYLVVINSAEENELLNGFLRDQSAFIGMHDLNQEGRYEWVNGESISYTNWYRGQPNNYRGSQDHVRMLPNDYWDDTYAHYQLEYIIEIPCLSIQQIAGPTSGSVFPEGTTTVAYRMEDACGNQTTCDFQVTVNECENTADYCECSSANTNYFWIRHVVCGDIDNVSTSQGGYSDFTNYQTDVAPGSKQTIILSPGFRSNRYYLNWKVWIDYNRDGDFDDANEEILTYRDYNILKIRFTVPQNCGVGETRMRVAMKYGGTPNSCEPFTYGEVEDYTINLLPPTDDFSAIANSRNNDFEVEIISHESTAEIKEFLLEDSPSLTVFPNPVRNVLQVQLSDYQEVDGTLRIYNSLGQIVYDQLLDNSSDQQLSIAVNQLPNGRYWLSIESDLMQPIIQKFDKQ